MPVYQYSGRSRRGELSSGLIEGESPDGVASRLLGNGITPIQIKLSVPKDEGDVMRTLRKLGFGAPTISDLVMFSRQMYTIAKSGIPLLRGIRGIAASTHNIVLRETLEEVLKDLEGGRDLAGSLGRHPKIFPSLYIAIVKVGEETGTLEASFKRLAEYLAQDQDMKDRIKSATRYPLIVMCTVAIAIGILTTFVIPKFAPLFKVLGDDIPVPTRIIMDVSTFAQNYWHFVFGAVVLSMLALKHYTNTENGRRFWDRTRLKVPVVGRIVHEGMLARVTRSLAIALGAGMPVIQTLKVIAHSAGNMFMSEQIMRIREAVERGEPLSRAANASGQFTPLVLQMMLIGEETGNLPSLLDEIADFYQREVDYKLKNLSSAIEPILVVAVGAIVCVLALGVMLPMWEMISKANGGSG
jgi:MSHA biogenesis protein MshG